MAIHYCLKKTVFLAIVRSHYVNRDKRSFKSIDLNLTTLVPCCQKVNIINVQPRFLLERHIGIYMLEFFGAKSKVNDIIKRIFIIFPYECTKKYETMCYYYL